MSHIIKLQLIECILNSKQDAFNMQHLVSRYYREVILPVLEKVFDELSGDDTLICLDHLEIDLGVIPASFVENSIWPDEYVRKFSNDVREEILRQISHRVITREHSRMGVFRQWLFYMQNGYLGWNASQFSEDQKNSVLETLATDYNSVSELRKLLTIEPVVVKRISRQHNEQFLVNLIKTITAVNQDQLRKYIDEIVPLLRIVHSRRRNVERLSEVELRQELWVQCLLHSTSRPTLAPREIAKTLIQYFITDESKLLKLITRKSIRNKLSYSIITELCESISTRLEREIKDAAASKTDQPGARKFNTVPADEKRADKDPSNNTVSNEVVKWKEQTRNAGDEFAIKKNIEVEISADMCISEEGIFVQNAGLVLIHSFLPSLFKKLSWIKEGQFIDHVCQHKAISFLHWIATGRFFPEEYELVMPKFLCAFPLKQFIETTIKVEPGEIEEADNMLKAVINHWDVLKHTSVDGLRQGFLTRNGRLFSNNDKTCLQVENNSIDVLLDRLPWNLSMIKLPWLKDMLWVDWR